MAQCCICIPARLHSTRLDKKLLLRFDNKTCIEKTIEQCLKTSIKDIYLLTDSQEIINIVKKYDINTIFTEKKCSNGTDRICKYLNKIDKKFQYIVNVQADEPFVSPKNIDFALEKHIKIMENSENKDIDRIFYTTLHEENNSKEYLKSTASLKLVTDKYDNVITYSRNIIPWNKKAIVNSSIKYKTFTGIYVYNMRHLENYENLDKSLLQEEEDCEQLRIIENNFKIKSYPTLVYNEISLNEKQDYDFLLEKYYNKKKNTIKFAVFDLDGVFTDGKIYVLEDSIMKCYNGKDSYGLKLLKNNGIKTGLITSHDTTVVDNMSHIINRMDYISKGSYTKIEILGQWIKELDINYEEVAYIGDDLNDIIIMSNVGFCACPQNAIQEIKNISNYICKNKSGDGAVREFCELLISKYI